MRLKPFFTMFGAKWRSAPRYPAPLHRTIIEPFAGAAGYSVRHADRNIILYEINPEFFGVWSYLIQVRPTEVMRIPVDIAHVDELIGWPDEVKWLVGLWFNKGAARPCKQRTRWSDLAPTSFWGEQVRARIADQVEYIRHWKIYNESYAQATYPHLATWYVDPPYQNWGKAYVNSEINYDHLATFCKTRMGQTIVCEQEGADWLPFQPFATVKAKCGKSKEVIWTK